MGVVTIRPGDPRAPAAADVEVDLAILLPAGGLFLAGRVNDRVRSATLSNGTELPIDVVIEAALRAQLADDGIWIRALRQTNAGISFNEGRPSPSVYVTGTLTSGGEWSGSLADTYVFVSAAITPGQATGGGSPIDIPDRPALQRFANPFMTVIAATAPWPSIATTLRVTVQGQPPVEMPLRQLGDSPIGGTIVVYDDLLPATAELLDASGAVIATG